MSDEDDDGLQSYTALACKQRAVMIADEAGDIDDKVMILKLFVFQRW